MKSLIYAETQALNITDVSDSVSTNDNWTCGCLYKCIECLKVEVEGDNKQDYFEKKDLDY